MGEGQPTRPANIEEIVAINQGRSPLTMGEPAAPALSPAEFAALVGSGHIVVDTREPAAFGAGHVPGAYSLKMGSPEFEQRVGWVVPLDAPMLLVLDGKEALRTALRKLAFVGLDSRVKGFLDGGMGAWTAAGREQATLPQISVSEVRRRLDNGDGMKVLDVREQAEWDEGYVEGATLMNFKVLEEHLGELDLDPEDRVSVVCAGGVRSSTACSILLRHGYRHVHNVTGGMGAWKAAELPTVSD
jgi:hydroxyacylglutathione hydrolase